MDQVTLKSGAPQAESHHACAASQSPAAPQCCTTCGDTLKSGLKYKDICTTCQPVFMQRCSGCQRLLWDCLCIRPHTWE